MEGPQDQWKRHSHHFYDCELLFCSLSSVFEIRAGRCCEVLLLLLLFAVGETLVTWVNLAQAAVQTELKQKANKDEADSRPHGSVCITLKSQTQGWSWQPSSWLCLYNTEITNTPTNQTAVIRTLSLRWNQNHKDNSDSSHYHQLLDNSDSGHYGSIFRMKLQTQAQFW